MAPAADRTLVIDLSSVPGSDGAETDWSGALRTHLGAFGTVESVTRRAGAGFDTGKHPAADTGDVLVVFEGAEAAAMAM